MRQRLIQPPAAEPVTLEEARYQCKIRHNHADVSLTRAIRAAREQAEQRTGRALITQGWEHAEACAAAELRLRIWPVSEVTDVIVDGVPLGIGDFIADLGDDARVRPTGESWAGRTVVVRYRAGYGATGEAVPAAIVQWMLYQIANSAEHSGSVVVGTIVAELAFIDRLLDPWMIPR